NALRSCVTAWVSTSSVGNVSGHTCASRLSRLTTRPALSASARSTPTALGVIRRGRRAPGACTSRSGRSTTHAPTRRRSAGGLTRGSGRSGMLLACSARHAVTGAHHGRVPAGGLRTPPSKVAGGSRRAGTVHRTFPPVIPITVQNYPNAPASAHSVFRVDSAAVRKRPRVSANGPAGTRGRRLGGPFPRGVPDMDFGSLHPGLSILQQAPANHLFQAAGAFDALALSTAASRGSIDLPSHLEQLAADGGLGDFLQSTGEAITLAERSPVFAEQLLPLLSEVRSALQQMPTDSLSFTDRQAVEATV